MLPRPPKIDERTVDDITRQALQVARQATAWRPQDDGPPDAGLALIQIFSHMMDLLINRLNRVPEKSLLAFLDLIGAQILPPRPARVPLTFTLAAGRQTGALVPALTQVAAQPAEGDVGEVIFETEQDLIVTPVQLKAAWIGDPVNDGYSAVALQADGKAGIAFSTTGDDEASDHGLYLGFDRPFDNRPMTLYIQLQPLLPTDEIRNTESDPARVRWEYAADLAGSGWKLLGASDETDHLAQSGLVQFIGPVDLARRELFGQDLYWLRASRVQGRFRSPPRVQRVLPNTTWASQATTRRDEVVGSSTGQANQVFHALHTPMLLGQRLEVRETASFSESEYAALIAELGPDALRIEQDESGRNSAVWVRWQAVPDFYGSTGQDRHVVIEHMTGAIRFGDGLHGRVPPLGRRNLRLASYRSGGGAQGNRPANSITQLMTTIPYIKQVTNPEPASGGAATESLEQVKERGPKVLRHRNRAVTAQDIEDLAREASTEVARVLVIRPRFDPGKLANDAWLPVLPVPIRQPGEVTVLVSLSEESDGDQSIEVEFRGPGQGTPLAPIAAQYGKLGLSITKIYDITKEQIDLDRAGDAWHLSLRNLSDEFFTASVTVIYPGGPEDGRTWTGVELPGKSLCDETLTVASAGEVRLLIVPQSTAPQPMPSLGLVRRVESYLQARLDPTVALSVSGPEWLQVTVTAQFAPRSMQTADALSARVRGELDRFLHPLHGGRTGRGWPFGRRPYLSDLYALLAAVEGVDHVDSLSIDPPPDASQPADAADRFLIYSGPHVITLTSAQTMTRSRR